jgi:hypothetical protein
MRLRCLPAVLLVVAISSAYGQESIYVGVGAGSFDYEEDSPVAILGLISDTVKTYKLFGGFEVNQYLSLEVSYRETSDIVRSGTGVIDPFGDVTQTLTTEFALTNLQAVGQLPLERIILLGGLGYYSSDNDFRETVMADCCGTLTGGGSISNNGLSALLGVEWRFGRFGTRYGIRLEYEWWDIDAISTSSIGFGFSYGF